MKKRNILINGDTLVGIPKKKERKKKKLESRTFSSFYYSLVEFSISVMNCNDNVTGLTCNSLSLFPRVLIYETNCRQNSFILLSILLTTPWFAFATDTLIFYGHASITMSHRSVTLTDWQGMLQNSLIISQKQEQISYGIFDQF